MPRFTRRRLLQLTGATATAALAGCGSDASTTDAFTDWLPPGDERTLTAYIDFTLTEKTSRIDPMLPLILPSDDAGDGGVVPVLPEFQKIGDPLVTFPLRTGGQLVGVSSIALDVAGVGYLVDPAEPAAGVTELFLANDTVVGTGEIDTDRADESLRAGTASFAGELAFEPAGSDGEYALYQSVTGKPATAAVSESAVVFGDTRQDVEAVIETRRNDRHRATEASDEFAWLFDAANAVTADLVLGWQGAPELDGFFWGDPDSEFATDLVSRADDVVASLSFAPERAELAAGFALRNQQTDRVAKERLSSRLGTASGDASVSVDADRLSAEVSYTEEALDFSFRESAPDTGTPGAPNTDDVPPAVDAAVPEHAFEFEYRENEGVVRVNFVASVEADEVTARAVASGNESATSTPEHVTYLTVFVAADGDEVVVTATVDGASGVVARHEVE